MSQATIDPPVIEEKPLSLLQNNADDQLHIYLSYDHLPIRNFYLLSKSVNELYELAFEIIHERPISNAELLVLSDIHTGNSVDAIFKIIEKLQPSKKAISALAIAASLIYAHSYIQDAIKIQAETELTRAQTQHFIADTGLIKANTEKAKQETERIKYENERFALEDSLKKQGVDEGYREKVLTRENLKRINRKLNSIRNQISAEPIHQAIINGNVIYNDNTTTIK